MGYNILNGDGLIVGYVETDAEAKALIDSVPDDIYTFFVGGLQKDIDKFFLDVNSDTGDYTPFFSMLAAKYGKIPDTIIPLEEIKDAYLNNNTVFLKLRVELLDSRLVAQLLSVLRRTVPAGSSFFVLVERREIEEGLTISDDEDLVDVFYSPDIPDELNDQFAEVLIQSQVLRG